ncbi:PTS sorbitol transporter subunit IIB [Clostridium botulinum]|uniref:PTS sorbitol transporter subunit IIB n=2 Tax=Clostridium botulinum TaxID=1491 RepID=A0A846I1R7_CLOBO|nr:hypothetical protein [Clostridium botulinum]ACA54837.1 hypothetical protein CLK_1007 [Clostridium botulinum A3 str. Loch Maree]ACQ51457.1 hypothetical protein CLJ_B1628 [Clostridium botulinum Ba4 str. 657]EDT86271.1 glucitol/sorbitol-specific phosphotransferase enzyme iib component [Clostridium botulinum Bf]EPS51371.1 hypothetical protein CFSAN002368_12903 [Clostridium botulinum A1 str. CFSAN002368]AUN03094.1 PTS sorbitol transporter subunit IIB [Clostridium botulinum]
MLKNSFKIIKGVGVKIKNLFIILNIEDIWNNLMDSVLCINMEVLIMKGD